MRLVAAALVGWLCACSKPQGADPAPSASAPVAPPPAAPVSAAASASSAPRGAAATAGQWVGTYEARQYKIEMSKKEGAVREWSEDKGGHTGKGSLTVDLAEDGSARGSAKGPLGDLALAGELDGADLRLSLGPADPEQTPAFTGTLLAKRDKDGFTGRLQASSGDSLIVREAPVFLRKKAP